MHIDQKVIDEINSKPFTLASRKGVVGLDGFVDKIVAPVEPEPAHIFLNGADVGFIFLGRVGVVEPQIAGA